MAGVLGSTESNVIDLKAILDDLEPVTDTLPLKALASLIKNDWQQAYQSRLNIETIMKQNLRQIEGEYDPDHLAAIMSAAGPKPLHPPYMMLTAGIAKTGEARVQSILSQSGELGWSLDPEPVSDLPPDLEREVSQSVAQDVVQKIALAATSSGQPLDPNVLAQGIATHQKDITSKVKSMLKVEAQLRAEGMEKLMRTQAADGGFETALDECIVDFFQHKTVIIKGPIIRTKKVLKYKTGKVGEAIPIVVDEKIYEWDRVDPTTFYPLLGTTTLEHGGAIQMHRFSRHDLNSLLGVPGYDDEEIRAVLEEYGHGGLHDWTALSVSDEVDTIKGKTSGDSMIDPLIDALQYWNWVQGSTLIEYGLDKKQVPDPDLDYPVEAWLIGNHIIRCVLNPDPLGEIPYDATSFDKIPGSFWGKSMPEKVRGAQMQCNSAARAISRNTGIASGPQVVVDKSLVPIGADTSIYPFKVWEMDGSKQNPMVGGSGRAPITFYYPPMVVDQLMSVYDKFEGKGYDLAGIPKPLEMPTSGDSPASTHSMAQTDKNKQIQLMVDNIENDLISKQMRRLYLYNLRYHPDKSIKGACRVSVKGIHYLAAKEQRSIRLQEFMGAAAQSPVITEIMGKAGLAEVIKQKVKDLGIDPDDAIQGQPNQAQPAQAVPPANPSALDAAGNPVSGRDTSTFPH